MTAEQVHSANLGNAGFNTAIASEHNALSAGRPTGFHLVERFGMWVTRCINLNASAAASVPMRLFSKTSPQRLEKMMGVRYNLRPINKQLRRHLTNRSPFGPGSRVKAIMASGQMDDVAEIVEHSALDLLRDINPWSDGFAWRESVFSDLDIFGQAYTHVVVDEKNTPGQLWRMLPQKTKVVPDRVEFVKAFELGSGADAQMFEPAEVVWFRLYDPEDPWSGRGPLESWLKTIDAGFAIQSFQWWLFQRGGTPDYVIKSMRGFSEDQKRTFRASWRRLFGRMFNREESVAFLEGDAELERLGQTQKELDYTQSESSKRDQIAAAFGVPKSLLTFDDVNLASANAGMEQHYRNLWPKIQRFEDTLNEQLIQRFYPEGLFLVHDNPIPEDETVRVQTRQSRLASGWSVNEIRSDEGVEAIEDETADQPMITSGLVPLTAVMTAMAEGMPGDGQGDGEDEAATEGRLAATVGDLTALGDAVSRGVMTTETARNALVLLFGATPEQAALLIPEIEQQEEEPDLEDDEDDDRPIPPAEPEERSATWTVNLPPPQVSIVERVVSQDGQGAKDGTLSAPPPPPPPPGPVEWTSQKTVWMDKFAVGEPMHEDLDAYDNPEFTAELQAVMLEQLERVIDRIEDEIPPKGCSAHRWRSVLDGGYVCDQCFSVGKADGDSIVRVRKQDLPPGPNKLGTWLPDAEVDEWMLELTEVSRRQIAKRLKSEGQAAIDAALEESGRQAVSITFDLANQRAATYLDNAARRIGRDATDAFRKTLREILVEAVGEGQSTAEIASTIRQRTGTAFVGHRAERIARTETAFASINGTEQGWEQSGVVMGKQFVLSPDACPACVAAAEELEMNGETGASKTFPLGQSFFEMGKELQWEEQGADGETKTRRMKLDYAPDDKGLTIPPVHPNCRCSVQPVLIGEEE